VAVAVVSILPPAAAVTTFMTAMITGAPCSAPVVVVVVSATAVTPS